MSRPGATHWRSTWESHPQGALFQPDGSVLWRVWAPEHPSVKLRLLRDGAWQEFAMKREPDGSFVHALAGVEEGARYAYRVPSVDLDLPDPASRWQPEGVHRPSAVLDSRRFVWQDDGWKGNTLDDLIVYEIHVGTFTPEGTFDAVIPRLAALKELGVTALEIMPVAQFPGARNWGYDGVHPFAVQNTYGGPHGLARLVNAAHQHGLAVHLDVVYNHLGPEGNYFSSFSPRYFTSRYHTPWGSALNYDDSDSEPVRRLAIDNACQWIRDFHIDGLRLDAVQMIYDNGPKHLLQEIQEAVQATARQQGRNVQVIAETDQNDVRLVRPPSEGGYGLDGVWSDDFHHAIHALLTEERHGLYRDYAEPAQQLAKAIEEVYIYDGCYSAYHRRRRGTSTEALPRKHFVACIQNHDQVGNRVNGDRLTTLVSPAAARLAASLLLLAPTTPLLFMGEEFGEERPFPFFCSFGDRGLTQAVRRGRQAEFAAMGFPKDITVPDPPSEQTFLSARLNWSWPDGSRSAKQRLLYRDLLKLRSELSSRWQRDLTSVRIVNASGVEDSGGIFLVIVYGDASPAMAIANLQDRKQSRPAVVPDGFQLRFSSEDEAYGGSASESYRGEILPYELQFFERTLLG